MATFGCSAMKQQHDSNIKYNNNKWLIVSLTFAIWSLLTLTNGSAVQAAAVYSNVDFLSNPNFEPICAEQQERFIESDGKESSLILEFNSNDVAAQSTESCKRILSAPTAYGFIVRLILPKIRNSHYHPHAKSSTETEMNKANNGKGGKIAAVANLNEMTSLIEKLNSTALKTALGRTCPLSIFSSLDPHTPQWRVDPCQLEDTAPEMEDPVRLFHGRLRIVWDHGQHALDSKLMVTVLGKGDQCRSETKHQCLKIGEEPILCISKDLVCDGIRHCPNSNEYDSDEDYTMCWRRRHFGEPIPAKQSDLFEHFALEVFRNLFAFDVPAMVAGTTTTTTTTTPSPTALDNANNNSTTLRKVHTTQMTSAGVGVANGKENEVYDENALNANATEATNGTDSSGGSSRRNSTRMGLNSDLSKYGPWGYLMLGMLLCGGALLICGLWASASQHAANNERESNLQHAGNVVNSSTNDHQSSGAPPNYEELDPPPPYSVLFPNQKAASSTTLNSLSTAAVTALAPALTTISAENSGATASEVTAPTTTTRVQLEAQAPSSSCGATTRVDAV